MNNDALLPKFVLQLILVFILGAAPISAWSAPGVAVKYRNNAYDNSVMIKPIIQLENTGSTAINLADYTIRYWYSDETAPSRQMLSVFYAINTGNWQSPCYYPYACIPYSFGSADDDNYVTLGFSENAGLLQAGNAIELQLGIHAANWSFYAQENDYSYTPPSSDFQRWNKITVYKNSVLVYGDEPVEENMPACTQQETHVLSFRLTPSVVDSNQTTPIQFGMRILGPRTEASICIASSLQAPCEEVIPLPGPNAQCDYLTELTPAQVTRFFNPETDINHATVGFVDVAITGQRFNLNANIYTSDIGLCNPLSVNAVTQQCEHVVNLVIPDFFQNTASLDSTKRKQVSKAFYKTYDDNYDFLNIVSVSLGYFQNRSFMRVKNDIDGIGLTPYDASAGWGSSGKLKGTVGFPLSTYFDGASKSHSHELGHNWLNFVDLPLLSQGAAHWPVSDVANDIMGYSGTGGQGLTFNKSLQIIDGVVQATTDNSPKEFSDLSLYLMGLLPAEEVANHFVMNDATNPNNFPSDAYEVFSIDDVIAANGPREPAYPNSQNSFRVATILVSESLLDEKAMSFFNYFAERMESLDSTLLTKEGLAGPTETRPFFSATGGKGTLNANID